MRWHVLLLLLLASCGGRSSAVADTGADSAPPDTTPPADVGPLPLTIDFTVEGCAQIDSSAPSCTGTAPFTVRFVPVATTTISQYRWIFGDDTSDDTSATPSHKFDTPGSFTVTLVGFSTGGVATKVHTDFIIVLPKGMGAPCQANQQCAKDLYCLCSSASPCTTGPLGGMCTSSCQKAACPVGNVCTNLATAFTNAGRAEPWQNQLCLPACDADADCSAGLRCRVLPAWPNGTSWVHGCFADVPADLGGPCRSAAGALRNDLCVAGLCADLGALGLCSRNCSATLCPAGSDCVVFGDGRELCLVPCASGFPCNSDPLLTCVGPALSLLGYRLKTPPLGEQAGAYCAPKPCADDTYCGAAGLCRQDSGGGHCVARAD